MGAIHIDHIADILIHEDDIENENLINSRLRHQEFDLSRRYFTELDIDGLGHVQFVFYQCQN